MLKLGILASGALGLDTLTKVFENYLIQFVLTDKKSKEIIKWAKEKKIPSYIGNPRTGEASLFIQEIKVDVICSINYLFLINKDIINHSRLLTFNIHGSLLPKYRGRTPHVWSIINNEKETGITAHIIDENCDTGSIISQTVIPIDYNDTGFSLLEKYKAEYYFIIQNVLSNLETNSLEFKAQDESIATYYHKREPKDGKINWNWQKERIRNWVRAQAYPYPGAFGYYNNEKVIIDKVSYSNYGFDSALENGTILKNNRELIVKTQNGAILIEKIRSKHNFIEGTLLK